MAGVLLDETGPGLFGDTGTEKTTFVDKLLVAADDEAGEITEEAAVTEAVVAWD